MAPLCITINYMKATLRTRSASYCIDNTLASIHPVNTNKRTLYQSKIFYVHSRRVKQWHLSEVLKVKVNPRTSKYTRNSAIPPKWPSTRMTSSREMTSPKVRMPECVQKVSLICVYKYSVNPTTGSRLVRRN